MIRFLSGAAPLRGHRLVAVVTDEHEVTVLVPLPWPPMKDVVLLPGCLRLPS